MSRIRDEELIQSKGLRLSARINTTNDICGLHVPAHNGELSLLVNRELCVHKTLIAGIGLLDISQMPLTDMGGVITRISKYFSKSNLLASQAITGKCGLGLG